MSHTNEPSKMAAEGSQVQARSAQRLDPVAIESRAHRRCAEFSKRKVRRTRFQSI